MSLAAILVLCTAQLSTAIPMRTADPFVGYVVVDAEVGEILDQKNGDAQAYPASIVKLMDLLIIVEAVEKGEHKLDEQVRVTAEASKIGGSQVYLKEGEVFTLDEMLAAMVVKSANDVAGALAIHMAGSTGGFVARMNDRAKQLGMTSTRFGSVHGLPPDMKKGQEVDSSTPSDIAKLCLEIVRHPLAMKYTSTTFRKFRNDTFELRSHNYLLGKVPGCDGLKTGFFDEAGFSIAATALRNGKRVIAVVMGSKSRQTRDQRAAELLETGFVRLVEVERERQEKKAREMREAAERAAKEKAEAAERARARRNAIIWSCVAGILVAGIVGAVVAARRRLGRRDDGFEFRIGPF